MKYDVVVLGAGAAGLMAAITAASRKKSVLVLERSNKVGKKILMSGGGRCNFTNTDLEFDNFISINEHFCKSALSRYTAWDFIDLVKKHEIEFEERKHNQLFCIHSAKDIVNMLLKELSTWKLGALPSEFALGCVKTSMDHYESIELGMGLPTG